MIADWDARTLAQLLVHTCEVWEPSSSAVDRGGLPVKTWAQKAGESARVCFLEPIDKSEIESGDVQILRADYRLFVGSDLAVNQTHQIRNVSGDGATYEIVKVDLFPKLYQGGLGAHIEVYLVRIT